MGAAPAARRCALLLALVVLVAVAGERGGSGAGGEAGAEQVLRLWSSADSARGGEAVDEEDRFFRWEWEDDDDNEEGEEDDHAVVVQRKGACRHVVNVDSFGAAGDGVADDTQVRARCRSAIDTSHPPDTK
jgi:galacturan 1,4-alpha-galacturonidase